MGRIKQRLIKRVAQQLHAENPDNFVTSFDKNKQTVDTLTDVQSKKLRNKIAGYACRLAKRQQ